MHPGVWWKRRERGGLGERVELRGRYLGLEDTVVNAGLGVFAGALVVFVEIVVGAWDGMVSVVKEGQRAVFLF